MLAAHTKTAQLILRNMNNMYSRIQIYTYIPVTYIIILKIKPLQIKINITSQDAHFQALLDCGATRTGFATGYYASVKRRESMNVPLMKLVGIYVYLCHPSKGITYIGKLNIRECTCCLHLNLQEYLYFTTKTAEKK